jgi:hypothetical protein
MSDISDLLNKEVLTKDEMVSLVGGKTLFNRFFSDSEVVELSNLYNPTQGTMNTYRWLRQGKPEQYTYQLAYQH